MFNYLTIKTMKRYILALLAIVAVFTTSCVKDDIYEGPASIEKIEFTPGSVTPKDAVTVSATITDLKSVTSAVIKYKVNGAGAQTINMTNSGSVYSGIIPKQADKSVVTFVIEAVNASGYTAVSVEKTYTVAAVVIDYSGLILNELNGNDKFIELYNKGKKDIPLEGVYIQKDGEINWTCNDKTLAAGAYILLYSEDVAADHPGYDEALIFHSGLSAKKNVRIQLFNPAGTSLDDFNLTAIAKTAKGSYSRGTDGKWYHAEATPGKVNAAGTELVEGLE